MTKEELKNQFPKLYNEILNEGITAERERFKKEKKIENAFNFELN